MSTAKVTVTVNSYPKGKDQTARHEVLYGSLAVSASPDAYATNGLPVSFAGADNAAAGSVVWVEAYGLSGYVYKFDLGHQTLRIFQAGGFTPAGTISAPLINTVDDAGTPTKALGELGGVLSSNGALTGITGVQAPTFTGSAVAAGALVELANGVAIPAAVSGDTISFRAEINKA